MAKTKNQPKGTGFNYGISGEMHPKGTTIKHNPDGTVTLVPPTKAKKANKKG